MNKKLERVLTIIWKTLTPFLFLLSFYTAFRYFFFRGEFSKITPYILMIVGIWAIIESYILPIRKQKEALSSFDDKR
ncbi:hypothetical protein [Falsibacillus albus]|uniref:Uncharacterized protein n=1 Tax=Falsibacillus albus TaxID=2478915 RepID=A0A3L7JXZ5_9BACI|nr:hypothetical protein [Falsibacillus albus]RLQ94551.1 hypothetical protein D9X91_13495 [Falsibacillus albus]